MAINSSDTFIAPLTRTALWNPNGPFMSLLSIIGWINDPRKIYTASAEQSMVKIFGGEGAPRADPEDIMPTAKALFCLK